MDSFPETWIGPKNDLMTKSLVADNFFAGIRIIG